MSIKQTSLDTEIATKVMNWHLSSSGMTWLDENNSTQYRIFGYTPSTDIAQAFRLMMGMKSRGYFPGIYFDGDGGLATFSANAASPYYKSPVCETFELAICKAALVEFEK